MAKRSNYTVDQIDKSNQARRNFDADPRNKDRKKELETEQARTNRALDQNSAGAGRGSTRPPMSKKWIEN